MEATQRSEFNEQGLVNNVYCVPDIYFNQGWFPYMIGVPRLSITEVLARFVAQAQCVDRY
jgi:hypothetical protein